MARDELIGELDRYMTIVSAIGVLPDVVDAHYVSWGARQVGEAGDSVEATVLVLSGQWFHTFELKFVGGSESAEEKAVRRDSVRGIKRAWKGRRGFDEEHFAHTAEEFSAEIEFDDGDAVRLPIRNTDYASQSEAWKRAQALLDVLMAAI